MKITINGQEREFNHAPTVLQLLEEMSLQSKQVAVERNREIVSSEALTTTELEDGDTLEIVHFVGGG